MDGLIYFFHLSNIFLTLKNKNKNWKIKNNVLNFEFDILAPLNFLLTIKFRFLKLAPPKSSALPFPHPPPRRIFRLIFGEVTRAVQNNKIIVEISSSNFSL